MCGVVHSPLSLQRCPRLNKVAAHAPNEVSQIHIAALPGRARGRPVGSGSSVPKLRRGRPPTRKQPTDTFGQPLKAQFACPNCGRRFGYRHNLKRHMLKGRGCEHYAEFVEHHQAFIANGEMETDDDEPNWMIEMPAPTLPSAVLVNDVIVPKCSFEVDWASRWVTP